MKLDPHLLAQAYRRGEWQALARLRQRLGRVTTGDAARSAEWIALACAGLGRMAEAAELFGALAEAEPGSVSHCVNLSASLLSAGKPEAALQIVRVGLLKWPAQSELQLNFGLSLFALGRYGECLPTMLRLLSAAPTDDRLRLYAARCAQEVGERVQAREMVEGWQPQWRAFDLPDLYQFAKLWIVEDRYAAAEEALEFILQSWPAEDTARLNLAILCERGNRLEQAAAHLQAVSVAGHGLPLYLLASGKLKARADAPADALEHFDRARALSPRNFDGLPPERFFSELEFERGVALDRLGRYAEAFAAFTEANRLIRDLHRRFHPATGDGMRVAWLADQPGLDSFVQGQRSAGSAVETPVFIVGFPRSGTTLLDQMLDAHPALQVLEERPALEAVVAELSRRPGGYPMALADCREPELESLRQLYWTSVDRHIVRQPGRRLVDKYPFNLVRIHLGMALFPRAKWVFAVRHPCDVVLSCFMQNFGFTDTTHGFWSLEQTASIYEQVMGLWLEQRGRLAPDCLDLRYEELIADFEPNARRLVEFLELPWDAAVLAYHQHARTRRIASPSYAQVVKPIYRSAQGRWLHYRPWFGPAEERLAPLAVLLGYADWR
ncbi:MAG: sulfotransferase [Nevskia sp.]|nr:sulfotransferase [Nevskia sp.]